MRKERDAPPQRWHQDCDTAVLAAVFFVTDGLGTEFSDCSPGNFLQLATRKGCEAQVEIVEEMWASTTNKPPVSPGPVLAGSLLVGALKSMPSTLEQWRLRWLGARPPAEGS